MNWLKKVATWATVFALCVLAGAPVFAKDSHTVKLFQPLAVNGTQIAPGEYQIKWEAQGADAKVTFAKDKRVVATAQAKIVDRSQKFSTNRVLFDEANNGTAKLTEIQLGGTTQSLVFTM